jgi:tRNA(adenine34) deaminase
LQEAEMVLIKAKFVGAIIVVNDRVIARSHNLTELLNDVTAHAEMPDHRQINLEEIFSRLHALRCLEPQMCAGALY